MGAWEDGVWASLLDLYLWVTWGSNGEKTGEVAHVEWLLHVCSVHGIITAALQM